MTRSTSPGGPATLEEAVSTYLRDAILDRRLRPGDHLVAETIASVLGVSRLPVRQALQRLDGSGLVEMRPNRGAVVAGPDGPALVALQDLLAVRRRLEPWGASLAAQVRTEAELDRMRAILRVGAAAAGRGDSAAAGRAHHDLVAAILDASHQRYLIEALRPLHHHTAVLFTLLADGAVPDGWSDHADTIEAIARSDSAAARATVSAHLRRVAAALAQAARGATRTERSGPST